MPTFKVTDPSTGRTIRLTGDSPPTEQELEEVFKTVSAQPAPDPSNPIQQADSQLMQAVNRSAGMADPLLNFARQAQQPQVSGEGTSQYMNPARFGGEDVRPPSAVASPEAKQRLEQGLANIPRYGVPIAAGAMTGGLGTLATAGAGGVGAIIGEAVSQAIEKLSGLRQEYSGKEVIASGVQGAVPVAQGAGFLKGIGNVAMQAGGGMAAEAIRTEGENFASGALVPGGVSALTQTVGGVARGIGGAASRAAARSETLEKIGATPTFGQAMPSMAALETRVSSRIGGQKLRQTLEQQGTDIADTVRSITGLEPQGADVLTRRLLEDLGAEEAQAVANASSGLADARSILERVRGTAQEQTAARAVQDATQAYEQVIQNTLFKGGKPDAFRIVKAGRTIEDVAQRAKTSIREKADELYSDANKMQDTPAFDLTAKIGKEDSFATRAKEVIAEIPTIYASGLKNISKLLGRSESVFLGQQMDPTAPITVGRTQKATLSELKGVRDELYDFADVAGEAIGNTKQSEIRGLAKHLSKMIDDQADEALGAAAANSVREGDKFYAEARPLLDLFGIKKAFVPETMERSQGGAALASRVAKQGLETPAYKNLETLVDKLNSLKAKGSPSISDINDSIRSALVEPSVNVNTGDIDFVKLADTLNTVERQSPGALAKLGFGSKTQLDRFVKLTEELKDKPGPEKLIALLDSKSPTGIAVASNAIASLPDLKDIGSVVAKLEKLAATNPQARAGLQSLRATEIERLLVDISVNGRSAKLSALEDFADSTKIEDYRTILGDNLFNRIKDDFLPGYKQLLEYRQAAGQAGATVRGAAEEQLLTGTGKALASTAAGRPGAGFWGIVADLSNLGMYKAAAGLMARAGGSTGYKSRADFMRTLDDVSRRIGSSANISAIQKYIDSGELPEEK